MDIFNTLEQIKIGTVSLNALLSAVVIYIICRIVIHWLKKFVTKGLERTKLDKGVRNFAVSAINIVAWCIAVLLIADCLDIPIASLVAVFSVVGVAISLSVQGILSNLFSGMILLVTHPFKVGDFVQIGEVSGTVQSIGMFHSVLLTVDGKNTFVPNGTITAANIENYTETDCRRVEMKLSVPMDVPTATVRSAVMGVVEDNDKILKAPAPSVSVESLGSTAHYICYVYCRAKDYWEVLYSLHEETLGVFQKLGINPPSGRMHIDVSRSLASPASEK